MYFMLKNLLIVLAAGAAAFILFIIVMNISRKRAEQMVQMLFIEKDTEGYRKMADSFLSKVLISSKQRLIFEMTYNRLTGNDEQLEAVFAALGKRKLAPQEAFERFQSVFQYDLKNEKYDDLEAEYKKITDQFGSSDDLYYKGTLREFSYMYNVDYKGDVSLLPDMEKLCSTIPVEQSKGIFAFRCFHLYTIKGDKKKAEKYRKMAAELLGKEVVDEMISIQHIDRQ